MRNDRTRFLDVQIAQIISIIKLFYPHVPLSNSYTIPKHMFKSFATILTYGACRFIP
ncbi:hypothetical protein V6Z11_D03G126100 [Gossypium hirsutum]